MDELDRLLAKAPYASLVDDAATPGLVNRLTIAAVDAPEPKGWSPRAKWGVVLAVPALLLVSTAAATLSLWGDFEFDAVIPIEYTTDTGTEVSCRWAMGIDVRDGMSTDVSDVEEWVAQHDWEGIGQRAYDTWLANPVELEGEYGGKQAREEAGFALLLIDMIHAEMPGNPLDRPGVSRGGTSDCTWTLH